jgi:hypothetical protein
VIGLLLGGRTTYLDELDDLGELMRIRELDDRYDLVATLTGRPLALRDRG